MHIKKSSKLYMYWQKGFNEVGPNEEIENLIKEITEKHDGDYGKCRIALELRKNAHVVKHKK